MLEFLYATVTFLTETWVSSMDGSRGMDFMSGGQMEGEVSLDAAFN